MRAAREAYEATDVHCVIVRGEGRAFSAGIDINQLGNVTKTLAKTTEPNGANTLDTVLQRLPGKVKAILRTATYGSWFNFYLCNFQVEGVPVSGHSGVPSCDQS